MALSDPDDAPAHGEGAVPGVSVRVRCWAYGLIAAAALIATWSQNIAFFRRNGNGGLTGFLRDAWSGPASASLSNDLMLVALAAVVFMLVESRRLGIRHSWIFVVVALVVAISVAFPLFLIVRERRLAAPRAERGRSPAP